MAERRFSRRRSLLMGRTVAAAALLGGVLRPARVLAGEPAADGVTAALAESHLIYVSPLHADGRESTCQAEVWFVADAGDAFVVTASDAWRARAVRNGLSRARVWVGDVGVWSDSDGAYRELPGAEAQASLVTDAAEHARLLERFGDKYTLEWVIWGPRFRNGLADGSRVMIRYRPSAV